MKKSLPLLIFLILFHGPLMASDVLERARDLVAKEKIEEALQLLRNYEKSHPQDVDVHELIQRILTRHDRRTEAVAEYEKRYEEQATGLNGYLYFRLLEVPSEREKGFRSVIQKDPESVWGYYGLANSLMDQDKLQEGADEAVAALGRVSEPAQLHYVLARIYRRMKDYTNASAHMGHFYRLDPKEEHLEDMVAYEWLEVQHAEPVPEKFRLAGDFLRKHKSKLSTEQALEIAFLYAEDANEPSKVKELVKIARKLQDKEKVPAGGEERDYYYRIRGASFALQGWVDAKAKKTSNALKNLKKAEEAGPASETFYFSSLSYELLGKKEEALTRAIKAATYPPVYRNSKERAAVIWKQIRGTEEGFEAALHQQRQEFAPQRKQRAQAQMVSENFDAFEMITQDGRKVTEKDLSGKISLFSFWAVWCPPCREELPHWNEFYAAHREDRDLQFAAVGDEPWETMLNYMKNHSYSFPVYRNEKYWEQFQIEGIPTLLLIGPDGKIRFRNLGFEEGMEYAEVLQWQIEAIRKTYDPTNR